MDFETYDRLKRVEYAAFAETVASILTAAIRAEPNLRLQHVQHRAKDPASLKKKLEDRGILDTPTLDAEIKDLAGCRLVFYTNSDVNRFLSSGIISDNFEVDWDRTKIHYPRLGSDKANDLFISQHYVVQFIDRRLTLPEYSAHRNMWCEVQVQTTRNHAWSEMAHDTIYRKLALSGFGGRLSLSIEDRMQKVMRQFSIPAGYEFQKVLDDFERLSAGKRLFDQGALAALAACDDNNSRHDILERFKEHVLPHYDDVTKVYPEISAVLIATVTQARKTPTRSTETPFGLLRGYSTLKIVSLAADIVDYLRYVDIHATFNVICELFAGADNDDERKRLLQSAERLSKHELDVWKQAGPVVQAILVEQIERLDDELLTPLTPLLLEVLTQILRPEVTGTSSTYESVTIHRGAVQASKELMRVRGAAIGVLKRLYCKAKSDAGRIAIIRALSAATATPTIGDYPNELLKIILGNTYEIVEFYAEFSGDQSYEVLQYLEHSFFFLYRRNSDMPIAIAADPEIADARDRLTASIVNFRDAINRDRNFLIYKLLVGFDSIFPPAWEQGDFGYREAKAYRDDQVNALTIEMTEDNADDWLILLTRCAGPRSSNRGDLRSFEGLLERIGETRPDIAIHYLDHPDQPLANFLPAILRGLSRSGRKADARRRVADWVARKMHVRQIAQYLRFAEDFDAGLLKATLNTALEKSDDDTLLEVLGTATARHKDHPGGLINTIVIPTVAYFTVRKDTRWVYTLWYERGDRSPFRELQLEQADTILGAMVFLVRIEHQSESILADIAEDWPERVIAFFGERMKYSGTKEANVQFEAIPFDLHDLRQPLSKVPDYIVGTTRAWFDENDESLAYGNSQLLAIVFPDFDENIKDRLASLIDSGIKRDIEFVISVLRNYEGQNFLHSTAKEIIDALPAGDSLLDQVGAVLESTGGVWGEFGFAEAYTQKREAIKSWLSDPREKVRSFAERQLRSLDRQIAAEQRRAEERLELRKRRYGGQDDQGDQ